MRTEREMLDLILDFARSDERVRAAWLNGSRANPDAVRDIYMDFDVVCAVTEVEPFVKDKRFLKRFGEIAVMQEPEGYPYRLNFSGERYVYLMQFTDVNRIDLSFVRIDRALSEYGADSQTILLLDKDGALPAIPPPTDRMYRVAKPSAREFAECNGEFRWVAPYVAKGIKRGEPTYAQEQLNACVRPELLKMLSWKAALPHDFNVSTGKCGKYLYRYLSPEEYRALLSTYCGTEEADMWRALLAAFDLFLSASEFVGGALGYPDENEQNLASLQYILHLKN